MLEVCVRCGRKATYDHPNKWCDYHWALWWIRGVYKPKTKRARRHWLKATIQSAKKLDRLDLMSKQDIPHFISKIIKRPVRWAKPIGDYEGRERTIEVFNADLQDQLSLLKEINKHKDQINKIVDGPLVVVFHSVKQTKERYADLIEHEFWKDHSVEEFSDELEDVDANIKPRL